RPERDLHASAISSSSSISFFFQAEDGIRDRNVTGVQTCALPIFAYKEIAGILEIPIGTVMSRLHRGRKLLRGLLTDYARERGIEIGRASCRERVEHEQGAGAVEEHNEGDAERIRARKHTGRTDRR